MSNLLVTLPTVKPKWKRSFQSTDILPSRSSCELISPLANNPRNSTCTVVVCPTCNENQVRYTCPKCLAPYCSIACYKIHDVPSKGDDKGGGRCTEEFYRDKVKQASDLHVKDESNVSHMRDILTRTFYDNEKNDDEKVLTQDDDDNEEAEVEGSNKNSILSDEELMALAKCGLSFSDDRDHECDNERISQDELLLQSLPLHVKLKFEQAVNNGELSHLVQKWHPFWLPKYNHDSTNNEDPVGNSNGQLFSPPIDERILSIPPIINRGHDIARVALQYNICEVIYITAWTLRLFNTGTVQYGEQEHVEDSELSIDMALFLNAHSRVLSGDARFQSTVEVLMECIERTSKEKIRRGGIYNAKDSKDDPSYDWQILVNDMICICRFRRVGLKTMFMAGDILEQAYRAVKKSSDGNKRHKLKRKKIMLAKKKLEYFTSWCNVHWDACCDGIVSDAESWLHEWTPRNEEAEVNDLLHSIRKEK